MSERFDDTRMEGARRATPASTRSCAALRARSSPRSCRAACSIQRSARRSGSAAVPMASSDPVAPCPASQRSFGAIVVLLLATAVTFAPASPGGRARPAAVAHCVASPDVRLQS